eukprot:CAMPEP_0183703226 /NCGR_PEP_ID=MMETSP0737-20130205/1046_1 /TAXON_ID=385413 /ORGANISM="Thalassiosira miniscula, Strain CCMP1093" /LENGTH=282 /DNA_ID=CAMNT_0025929945 /DNA_START=42 /DNA_END=890 /DNA_ORIENTATION=+
MSSKRLTFSIPTNAGDGNDELKILLHQATTEDSNQGENETNTGFVMWPAAVMLSHHLSRNPHILRGDGTPEGDIMELGAGCGLVGLTAAALLQNENPDNDDKVIFTDYNPAVLQNLKTNILLNEFNVEHEVFGLDWFDQQPDAGEAEAVEKEENTWVDTEGTSHGQCRLILGADLLVCSNDADLVASTIDSTLMKGGNAFILGPSADARFGVSDFPDSCRSLGLKVIVDENILEAKENAGGSDSSYQQLMSELELSGHNQRASTWGSDFTMFTITKPITSSC